MSVIRFLPLPSRATTHTCAFGELSAAGGVAGLGCVCSDGGFSIGGAELEMKPSHFPSGLQRGDRAGMPATSGFGSALPSDGTIHISELRLFFVKSAVVTT